MVDPSTYNALNLEQRGATASSAPTTNGSLHRRTHSSHHRNNRRSGSSSGHRSNNNNNSDDDDDSVHDGSKAPQRRHTIEFSTPPSKEEVNPQDATLPHNSPSGTLETASSSEADFAVTVHDGSSDNSSIRDDEDDDMDDAAARRKSKPKQGKSATPSKRSVETEDETSHEPLQSSSTNAPTSVSPSKSEESTDAGELGQASASDEKNGTSPSVRKRKKARKRGRLAREADLEDESTPQGLTIPSNQYECVLRRRAVRKLEDAPHGYEPRSSSGSLYGDTSLGMKLTISAGKVIVQSLIALSDGRASPAQLTGVIAPGDILLAINNVSLLNLNAEQLMRGLEPLSKPNYEGVYRKELTLRFESQTGLILLEESARAKEAAAAAAATNTYADGVHDMFTLFPMDQLSGRYLADQQNAAAREPLAPLPGHMHRNSGESLSHFGLDSMHPGLDESFVGDKHHVIPLDEAISNDIARHVSRDKTRYASKFYAWNNEGIAGMLKVKTLEPLSKIASSSSSDEEDFSGHESTLTNNQVQARGRRATLGALALSSQAEVLDKGGEKSNTLKSWSATLTMYSRSRAGTRRRLFDAAASLPAGFGAMEEIEEESDMEDQSGKMSSNNPEDLDADMILIGLAAHDEAWRKQVVESLEDVVKKFNDAFNNPVPEVQKDGSTDALSDDMGNFLFGECVNNIIQKRLRPQALPPEDVTAVLFDLTTKTSSHLPDEITIAADPLSYRSDRAPVQMQSSPKKHIVGSDCYLATQFLLDKALPTWLQTFRALPWEERRIIWPLEKKAYGGSTIGSNHSDDSLTLDSRFTSNQLSLGSRQRSQKTLREAIEEQELDPQTRAETRFLTTFYFTQKVLPKWGKLTETSEKDEITKVEEEISNFVFEFGAYLSLPVCLTNAAKLKASSTIKLLLELSQHDVLHKEAVKHASKTTSLLFFEPSMLSAAVEMLTNIRIVPSERKLLIIDVCASAYPDIRPWQVREECMGEESSGPKHAVLSDLYYQYLSNLLHHQDGHETARRDSSLVKEWCELSVREKDNGTFPNNGRTRLSNFVTVASRATSSYLSYRRDLMHLLLLAMEVKEFELALDLAWEILEDDSFSDDRKSLSTVFETLRIIGVSAIGTGSEPSKSSLQLLKRLLRIYGKEQDSESELVVEMLDIPAELLKWVDHLSNSTTLNEKKLKWLVDFLATEASASDALAAVQLKLSSLDSSKKVEIDVIPLIHTTLSRAACTSASGELSGSLLRMKHAHDRLEETCFSRYCESSNLWAQMSNGLLAVNK